MMLDSIDELIEQHIRTYRLILKEEGTIAIDQLISSHNSMHSLLHEKGREKEIDTAAFIYSILRLPECISHVHHIILGQSYTVFKKNNLAHIAEWKNVSASGRRRKMYYDGGDSLAVYIASVTDVDDLITILTAYQIEWNKFHELLQDTNHVIADEDVERLKIIVGDKYEEFIQAVKRHPLSFDVQLLSGSHIEYIRSTQMWWNHVAEHTKDYGISEHPVYFVSSNTHSLVNILTRTAVHKQDELIHFIEESNDEPMKQIWKDMNEGKYPGEKEYFYHYIAKKYERMHPEYGGEKQKEIEALGIRECSSHNYIDVPVQVIPVKSLAGRQISLTEHLPQSLEKSEAFIINIDYPLGWAAFQILSEITQNVEYISGVYIMGKAAILHGDIGDIVLPTEVYDTHSKNMFLFHNMLTRDLVAQFYRTGTIFSDEKNITVKGTFFENQSLLEQWKAQGYNTIEMEAGPYLNAISECVFYNRYHTRRVVPLSTLPFDFGMAYYASDTPNSKAKNLGSRNLSYDGVECTYGLTLAILKRIVEKETAPR